MRALWGLTFRTEEMSAHKHGICSMTTVVRCPRTGRACSEGACRERHWCRQMLECGLSHRGLPLKRKFRPRCCARTRAGAPCIMRVVPHKRRCRFHGGMSTGPRTKAGRARIAEAQRRRWRAFRSRKYWALPRFLGKTPLRAHARTTGIENGDDTAGQQGSGTPPHSVSANPCKRNWASCSGLCCAL